MSHLDPEQIAAYLDRTLSAVAYGRVEAHLVECRDCRTEVLEVERLAASVPGPRRWAAVPLLAAAAAAVVLVVMLPGRPAPEPLHREPTVQSSLASQRRAARPPTVSVELTSSSTSAELSKGWATGR